MVLGPIRRIAWAIDSGTPVPNGEAPPSPELEGQDIARLRFEIAHPEVPHRLQHLDRQIAIAVEDLALERQALDGIAPGVSQLPPPHPGIEQELGGPDLGMGLGL